MALSSVGLVCEMRVAGKDACVAAARYSCRDAEVGVYQNAVDGFSVAHVTISLAILLAELGYTQSASLLPLRAD